MTTWSVTSAPLASSFIFSSSKTERPLKAGICGCGECCCCCDPGDPGDGELDRCEALDAALPRLASANMAPADIIDFCRVSDASAASFIDDLSWLAESSCFHRLYGQTQRNRQLGRPLAEMPRPLGGI